MEVLPQMRIEIGILLLLIPLFFFLLVKHIVLKRQIRNLTGQIRRRKEGACDKMLDISLVDHDLEHLAEEFDQYYINQRRSVAAALQHEEHLKESIANISHDLRTPLTVIMGQLQLLQSSGLTEEQNRRVEAALHKAGQLKELTGTFYDLSVLDTSRLQPVMKRINFSNLLADFIADNALLFQEKQIQPHIILPKTSLFIEADRSITERILQNLLVNAIRYTAGGIKMTLSRTTDGKAAFVISNPIREDAPPDIHRLFERFYTGDQSRGSGSTGLGLTVAKLLAEKMGGSLSAELHLQTLSITFLI